MTLCGRTWLVVVSLIAVLLACGSAQCDGIADERLLLGFEPDEVRRIVKALEKQTIRKTAGKSADGNEQVTLGTRPWSGFQKWTLERGEASQGEWALLLRPTKLSTWYGNRPRPAGLDVVDRYYGLYERPTGVFNIAGVFRQVLPQDWSKHDLLRFDILLQGSAQTVHIAMEDEEISPPVVREVSVKAGAWTTVEVDLRSAAQRRGLDPSSMATLRIGLSLPDAAEAAKVARRTSKQPAARLDNLRLCRATMPTKLPRVRDTRPHDLPQAFRPPASGAATANLPAGKPDHVPLEPEQPFRIETPKPCFVSPIGWVAAYDNRRMLVGFNLGGGKNAYVWQTTDGGRNWRGWDGAAEPGLVPVREITHQAGRGDVVGTRADVMLLTNVACNGPGSAGPTLFTESLILGPAGWKLRERPVLVDSDLRHCNSNQSIVRATSGRLYAAYGYSSRLGTMALGVRYSDNNGLSWHSWRPGKNGVIPGGLHSQEGGSGFGYTFEEPCLVPLGNHVACIWCRRQGYAYHEIVWTRFDGKRWSPVEVIVETKRRDAYNPTRPAIHAVGVGEREVFMVNALYDGVLHYRDGKWNPEAVKIPAGSRISVAGGRHVVVVAAVGEGHDLRTSLEVVRKTGAVELRSWQRLANGTWKGPITVAREPIPLASPDNRYYARPGFVVQPYAPPNFVPIAWSCGKNWIKLLRIPINSASGGSK